MAGRTLSPTEFASLVASVTSAFGDPTRRDIYLSVHESADGMTASEVAEVISLHPNVARHHLDKLVAAGHLDVRARSTGGAGRPAKVYRANEESLTLNVDIGHDDILVTLLGKALSRLGDDVASELALEVGREFGRQMAPALAGPNRADSTQQSFRAALHMVADALSSHGFAARAERVDSQSDELQIVAGHCPFGDVAIEHPVICAVDRGMVEGLLGSLYGETAVALSSSLARGDDACVTGVEPT